MDGVEVMIMDFVRPIKEELNQYADETRASFQASYFQAFPGGYGAGDVFIGVVVPNERKVARKFYKQASLDAIAVLLREPIHECRLTALLILVLKYETTKDPVERKAIVDLYLENASYVNNWDLVDASAEKILGSYLLGKDKAILYELANSTDLWKERIAVLATFHFIKHNEYHDALEIALILLTHRHDLIHKAVGWMLREIGNRDFAVEFGFLKDHYKRMPRTMLRYAIEKFGEELRQQFLQGLV